MAHCNLCNKNTRCSCKGGGCPGCGSTNKQVSFLNDLLKFGISKDLVKENLNKYRTYTGKIDSYTAYEYISGEIDEEKFNQAITDYKGGTKRSAPKKKIDIKEFKPTTNPERACVFNGPGAWERCIHCNSIRKYMVGKECPSYKGKD